MILFNLTFNVHILDIFFFVTNMCIVMSGRLIKCFLEVIQSKSGHRMKLPPLFVEAYIYFLN